MQEGFSMTLQQAFGEALKKARKSRGLKQSEAAELCRLSIREYGNLERGCSSPSDETIMRAYHAFCINFYELDFDLPDKE